MEIVRYLTARYIPRQTLSARIGAPNLRARRTNKAWAMRPKNLAMSQGPETTHLP